MEIGNPVVKTVFFSGKPKTIMAKSGIVSRALVKAKRLGMECGEVELFLATKILYGCLNGLSDFPIIDSLYK